MLLNAGLAQSAERGANNATVTGSSPVFRMCTFLLTAPIKQLAIVHLVNSILKSKKMCPLYFLSILIQLGKKTFLSCWFFYVKKFHHSQGSGPYVIGWVNLCDASTYRDRHFGMHLHNEQVNKPQTNHG